MSDSFALLKNKQIKFTILKEKMVGYFNDCSCLYIAPVCIGLFLHGTLIIYTAVSLKYFSKTLINIPDT